MRHFLDLDVVFRDATDEEVESLFKGAMFSVVNIADVKAMANTVLRRKLQHVREAVAAGKKFDVNKLQLVAKRDLHLALTVTKGAVTVPTDAADFRKFVQLLADDFVESIVDPNAKFVTSSKRPLDP